MKISRKLFILFFIGWMVFLTVFSLMPFEGMDMGGQCDKVAHFIAYFFTALLFYVALREHFKLAEVFAMFFAFGYGLILELVQHFAPPRVFSFLDMAANLAGVLFFFVFFRMLRAKW